MRLYYTLFLLLTLGCATVYGQQPTRGDLEKRRANLLNEIAETQQQLEATKKDKKATMGQLNALMAKLRTREKLIDNINSELTNINGNISTSTQEIQQLNKNLDGLRTGYARSIRYAYKHRESQNMMAFLFSANDFNDAIRRMQYLKKYRDYRKDQAEKIRATQDQLKQKIGVLNTQKTQKGALLKAEELQKSEIQDETKQTNEVVMELKGREKELVSQIQQNQKTARRLEATIKDQIKKEIELARKKAIEEARKRALEEQARKKAAEELARRKAAEDEERRRAAAAANSGNAYKAGNQTVTLNTGSNNKPAANAPATPPAASNKPAANNPPPSRPVYTEPESKPAAADKTSYKLSLTPEVQAVSNNFAANRGRLPWPVEKGYISGSYGRHPHPLFPKVMLENKGIDISTGEGAPVRSVFEGTVTKIANVDGTMVMISHGEYFTIYTNLSGASVRAGDHVSAKQVIGRAGKNDEGDNMMNFQIWRVGGNSNINTVNPADWIAR